MPIYHSYIHTVNCVLACLPGDIASADKNCIVWHLTSDQQLVSYKKRPLPLCELLRSLAVERGLAEVAVEDHVVKQRFHPVASMLSSLQFFHQLVDVWTGREGLFSEPLSRLHCEL